VRISTITKSALVATALALSVNLVAPVPSAQAGLLGGALARLSSVGSSAADAGRAPALWSVVSQARFGPATGAVRHGTTSGASWLTSGGGWKMSAGA
jgi:hypothetical protein